MQKTLKRTQQILKTAQLASDIVNKIGNSLTPGISTGEIDQQIQIECAKYNLSSGALNYHNYPGFSCISVDDEICHTPPHFNKKIAGNNLVKIDLCVKEYKYYGDICRSFIVPGPDSTRRREAARLKQKTEEIVRIIKQLSPKNTEFLAQIIKTYVEREKLCSIIELGGHGIGEQMHMPPFIANDPSVLPQTYTFAEGDTFTIEPMFYYPDELIREGWTYKTKNGKIGCQYEETIGIINGKFIGQSS